MENENENLNSPNTEEEEDINSLIDDNNQEDGTDEEKAAKLEEANKKLFARAKKAEEELKAFKSSSKAEAEKPKPEPEPKPEAGDLEKVIDEKLNERDLATMDLSDELKSEVKAYAKGKGITYREVLKTPYFNFIKEQEDIRIKSEEASTSSTNKATKAKRDFGNLKEKDISKLSDEEFDQYKEWLKSQE